MNRFNFADFKNNKYFQIELGFGNIKCESETLEEFEFIINNYIILKQNQQMLKKIYNIMTYPRLICETIDLSLKQNDFITFSFIVHFFHKLLCVDNLYLISRITFNLPPDVWTKLQFYFRKKQFGLIVLCHFF